jgi:ligand-binding sensor domain-containing protein/two-component sensor histidine kinase
VAVRVAHSSRAEPSGCTRAGALDASGTGTAAAIAGTTVTTRQRAVRSERSSSWRSRITVPVVLALALSIVPRPDVRADDLAADGPPAYTLTAWTGKGGEPPGDVFAIAQDAAGYLWLGTPTGLVRFDGARFTRWPRVHGMTLPNGPVHALVGDADGSLWIGYGGGGGIVRIGGGTAVRYAAEHGAPPGATAMIRDRHGAIWAAGRRGLFRFVDGRWTAMSAADGYPAVEAFSVYEDRAGRLWVGTSAGLLRRSGDRFEIVDASATNAQSIAEDANGRLWITHPSALASPLGGSPPATASTVRLPAGGWRLFSDSRGEFWVAAFSGLMRMAETQPGESLLERVEYEHRLPGSPRALFEDRERNLWVGMRGGLLRVSRSAFAPVPRLDGVTSDGVRTAAVGRDGSIWVATGQAVNRFTQDSATAYAIPQTTALHADARGEVWIATSQGLGRFVDGRVEPLPIPAATRPPRVMALTTDRDHRVWLCSALRGVSRWDGSTLDSFTNHARIAGRSCQSIHTDTTGRVWIGFLGGGVAVFDNGTFRTFGEQEGVAGGTALAILEDRSGATWFATTEGVTRLANGRVTTMTRAHAPLVDVVPVLVEDEDGGIWIGVDSGAGILRVQPGEMDKIAVNPSHHVEFAFFDESDGLQEGTQTWQAGVGGVRGPDGRLWVATGQGMAIIDPANLPRPPRPMPPSIEAVVIDGRRLSPEQGITLPSRTSTLAVEFAAVNLSSASKLRFRYMLEGVDGEWVYAGNVPQATYATLPTGEHRFRVSATSTGAWTEPSVWAFVVAPPFYRTPSFLLFTAIAGMTVLAGSWWFRLRSVRRQYALVFAERARVSREIHDTLLQSLAAIGVELETIATSLDPGQSGTRDALRRLRREVGRSVRDARDSIRELRHNPMQQRSLAEALADLVAAVKAKGAPVSLSVEGRAQKADPEAEVQLLRITQEAVQNAMKHARASQVAVTLTYEPERLVLRVADDGRGFAPEDFDPPPATGEQLGLVTMRERAARVRGSLAIVSRPGGGTIVEAAIPLAGTR